MAAMVGSPRAKVSRITTACNPCRSRKQKCSGRRPKCEPCSEYNRACEWPEQLKRGPAKGYVEALEQRLHETEDVLLKILSQLEHAQLESMLSTTQNSISTGDVCQDKKKSSRAILLPARKLGVEYWKSFPLRDAESIQRWQQDCFYRLRSNSSRTQRSEEDHSLLQLVRPEPFTDVNADLGLQPPRDDMFSMNIERDQVPAPVVGNDLKNRPLRPKANRVQSSTKRDESDISKLSSWKAAPSKEFQQKFHL